MAKNKVFKTMDGNEAAAYVSYAFTEVATIYPITPSSPMADHVDAWATNGKKNLFGQPVKLVEMQAESGAAGAMHGSLETGSLTSTYTASQGLLLMIPPMYRIAGSQLPGVMHVSARTVATHSLSIFGDHSDVMACRQTGFALLASSNVQECMDIGAVAHLSAIKGHVPFLHFFDGFRTSHEIQKIDVLDFGDLAKLVDYGELEKFRKRSLNPERPLLRTAGLNADTYFQCREAMNPYYDALPEIVEEYMGKMSELTGREYHCVNYYGDPEAEYVLVGMGSVAETAAETIDYLRAQGKKVGYVNVHLYRPFSVQYLLNALPATVKAVTVLDRTKEPGAPGEPLYLDVCDALWEGKRTNIEALCGRYGLGSKDTTPAQMKAVFDNMKGEKKNHFTVGINDDVTHLSLPVGENIVTAGKSIISCKFWGLGSDGTVGANKNSIKIIGDHTDQYAQAYFEYDSKKSGGVTKSHLRFGHEPIHSTYYVTMADFVACHNKAYVANYDMVSDLKEGGSFLLACDWADVAALDAHLPVSMRRAIARKHINLYVIDSVAIAAELGLGNRTNTILQAAFFHITGIIPDDKAVEYMKAAAKKSYGKKGDAVVQMNWKAIDAGVDAVHKVNVPESWHNPAPDAAPKALKGSDALVKQIRDVMEPISRMDGDSLPVSAFEGNVNGEWEQGASAYEKRGTAVMVPEWDAEKCIQCNQCAFVCSHATIRPFCLTADEAANAPESTKLADTKPKAGEYKFTMAVSPLDCMGCGECVTVCPTKAIEMKPQESQAAQQAAFDYCVENIRKKDNIPGVVSDISVKGSQFNQPLLEFSGSCAGCAETSYARLITQLFGEKMFISNATGCSSIWGGTASISPYTTNKESGFGPAWINSLFEDNAEHGLGMQIGYETVRANLITKVEALKGKNADLDAVIDKYLETKNNTKANDAPAKALIAALEACGCDESKEILKDKQYLAKKSFWIFGGDGWAYDIGYGGLDHVLASGHDVNVMVFDTEMYSNTGGQASKASNIGEVCQFAAAGKEISKKSLAEICMTYGYIYVAQIALGANMAQAVKAIAEAEAYPGPSIIIGYAPCELHGVKGGMTNCQNEMKKAVEAGYWNLFTFNPANKAQGKNPFTLTSKAVDAEKYQALLANETRYSRLTRAFPDRAKQLFARNEQVANDRYEHLTRLVELYK